MNKSSALLAAVELTTTAETRASYADSSDTIVSFAVAGSSIVVIVIVILVIIIIRYRRRRRSSQPQER